MCVLNWDHVDRLVPDPTGGKRASKCYCSDKGENGGQYGNGYPMDLCSGGDSAPGAVWDMFPTRQENAWISVALAV